MASKKVKHSCEGKGGDEPNIMEIDRISELPDSVIHKIFLFLPTLYVVRMSILSKRWRRMWIYIPVLYFEEFKDVTFKSKVKRQRKKFFKFVSNCLRLRRLSMLNSADPIFMTRFKLEMQYSFGGGTSEKIDDWLSIAVQDNVKELDLCIRQSYNGCYCLPQSVLDSRSLTLLKLENLKLEIAFPAGLPSLKALYLNSVEFDDKTLQNLISGCPVIKELCLSVCSLGDIDLAVSGTLRNLSLWYVKLTDQQLEGLVNQLPLLEKLTLYSCGDRLKNINIHSHSLKSLLLRDDVIEAKLRTPNLVCLFYEGSVKATILIDAPNLLEANLKLIHPKKASLNLHNLCLDKTSFLDLILFLSYFKCLKKMTLSFDKTEYFIIPKDKKRNSCCTPLPSLKHLKVKIILEFEGASKLRDFFLWCAPSLETLEIENQFRPYDWLYKDMYLYRIM